MKSRVANTIIISYHLFCEFIGSVATIILACFSYLSDYLQIKLKHTPFKSIFAFFRWNHSTCAWKHSILNWKHYTCAYKHCTLNHKHCTLNHKHCTLNWKHSTLNWKHSICAWKHSKINRIYKAFTDKHLCAKYVCRFIDYKQTSATFLQLYSKLYDFTFHCHCGYSNVLRHEKHVVDYDNKSGKPILYTGFS